MGPSEYDHYKYTEIFANIDTLVVKFFEIVLKSKLATKHHFSTIYLRIMIGW